MDSLLFVVATVLFASLDIINKKYVEMLQLTLLIAYHIKVGTYY